MPRITLIVLFAFFATTALFGGNAMAEENLQSSIESIENLIERRANSGRAYLEFLRVPTMNAGVYSLAAGAVDKQQPHDEDELYYVVKGKATMITGDHSEKVEAGAVIFVAAGVPHRFADIEEGLEVLVFFAAGGSGAEE